MMQFGIKGHFNIKKFSKAGILLGEWDFDNLITDFGLNEVVNANFTAYCSVGDGVGEPSFGQNTMFNWVAAAIRSVQSLTIDPTSPYDMHHIGGYDFAVGTFNGQNLTEVGISRLNSGVSTLLFSHAKILDSNGQPTTITVLSNESLLVEYTLTSTLPAGNTAGAFDLSIDGTPTPHTYQMSVWNVLANWGWSIFSDSVFPNGSRGYSDREQKLELFNGYPNAGLDTDLPPQAWEDQTPWAPEYEVGQLEPGQSDAVATSFEADAYVQNSHELTGRGIWDTTKVNYATGIGRIVFPTSWGQAQFVLDTKIMKTNTKSLRLEFKTTWDRV